MLKISKNVGLTDVVSTNQLPYLEGETQVSEPTATTTNNPDYNPLSTQHPIEGSVVVVQAWLFNDAVAKRYESITIDPTDAVGADESTWIALSLDGVTYQAPSAPLTMANISNSGVGYTFYVKVTTPLVAETQNKTDIKLTTNYTEFAV